MRLCVHTASHDVSAHESLGAPGNGFNSENVCPRRCVICGADVSNRRADAVHCSKRCRDFSWKLRRLLRGEPIRAHAHVSSFLARRTRPRSS